MVATGVLQLKLRLGRVHQGAAYQKSVKARLLQVLQLGGGGNAALGHFQTLFGQFSGQREGMAHVGVERAQVAVVDAHHVGPGFQAGHFRGVVQLQQYLQPQVVGLRRQSAAHGRRQYGGNEQHRVGSGGPRLQQLVFGTDEVLAQYGQLAEVARLAQVVQRAAEEFLVGQHRQGGGSALRILRNDVGHLGLAANPAARGRAALELGNDACSGFPQAP